MNYTERNPLAYPMEHENQSSLASALQTLKELSARDFRRWSGIPSDRYRTERDQQAISGTADEKGHSA